MEILYLNVKHYVAVNMLKSIGWLLTLRYELEYNFHIFHLFLNGFFLPKSISVLLVNGNHLVNCKAAGTHTYESFLGIKHCAIQHKNNPVSFLTDMMNPLVKW